jgi:zinc protease
LPATIDPNIYTITVTVHPERTAENAIAVLDDEIKRVQDELPSKDALARAVKQARALFAYGSESITNQAFWLGFTEMFASYEWFENYLDNLAAVTPEDIQRIAQGFLKPNNRVLGTYLPTGNDTEVPA